MVDALISQTGSLITDPAPADFLEGERANSSASWHATIQNVSKGIDHGLMQGLGDDDHVIYAMLGGRAGGQSIKGGTGAGDDLLLESTNHATKGHIALHATTTVIVDCVNNRVGLKNAAPQSSLHIGNNDNGSRNPAGIDDGSTIRFGKESLNADGQAMIIGGSCGSGSGFVQIKCNSLSEGALTVLRRDGETGLTDDDLAITGIPKNTTTGYSVIRSRGVGVVIGDADAAYGHVAFVNGNLCIGVPLIPGTNANKVITIGNGTPPSTSPADAAAIYAADYSAGNSCIHFREEGGSVIKMKRQLKASYNNWASMSDLLNALVAMGIIDAA